MSIRSRLTLALAACLAVSAFAGTAQAQTVGYNVRTGDVWVDSRLGEINNYGTRYRDPFISELSNNYGAPRSYITELLTVRRWAPADVYYACAMARALNRPCQEIVREYDRNPGQGWGAMAQRMGMRPGSPAFHALKRGTAATYDRWGYPVVVDRNVHVDWSKRGPGHGKPASHANGPYTAHPGGGKSEASHGNANNKGKPASHFGAQGKGNGNGNAKGKSAAPHGGDKGKGNGKGKGG